MEIDMLKELGFHKNARKQKEEWVDLPESSVPGMYTMRALKSLKNSPNQRIQIQFTPEYQKQMEDTVMKLMLGGLDNKDTALKKTAGEGLGMGKLKEINEINEIDELTASVLKGRRIIIHPEEAEGLGKLVLSRAKESGEALAKELARAGVKLPHQL